MAAMTRRSTLWVRSESVQAVADASPQDLVNAVSGLNLQTAKSIVREAKRLL